MQRLGWILATALLCSCKAEPPPDQATPAAATEQPVQSGVDLVGIDKSVKPGDDFDAYANGGWRKATAIPEDRSTTGSFVVLVELAEKRNAELLQSLEAAKPAAGSDARKIADYYAAYMDEAGIEKRGLDPLKPELAKIDAIATPALRASLHSFCLRRCVGVDSATAFANVRTLDGLVDLAFFRSIRLTHEQQVTLQDAATRRQLWPRLNTFNYSPPFDLAAEP